jgi:hypothetical protein
MDALALTFVSDFPGSNKVFEAQKQRQESDEDHGHSDRVQSIPRPPLIFPIGRQLVHVPTLYSIIDRNWSKDAEEDDGDPKNGCEK